MLKGMAYHRELYRQMFPKSSGDIDLLIPIEEFRQVHNYLLQNGFRQYFHADDTHGTRARQAGKHPLEYGVSECHYVRNDDCFDVHVDIHGEISVCNEFEGLPLRQWFPAQHLPWQTNTQTVHTDRFSFRRLCPEMHFLHLVLHMAHHRFSGMKWFLELCRFLEIFGADLDWTMYDRLELNRNYRRLMGILLRLVADVTGEERPGADKWRLFWTHTSEKEFRFFQSCLETENLSQLQQYKTFVLLGADWRQQSSMLSFLLFDGQAVVRFRDNAAYQLMAPLIQPFYLMGRAGWAAARKMKS